MIRRLNIQHRNRPGGPSAHRRRMVGTGTAFLALGLTPLVSTPPARADFDWLVDLLDPLINSSDVDPGVWAWLDPAGATWY